MLDLSLDNVLSNLQKNKLHHSHRVDIDRQSYGFVFSERWSMVSMDNILKRFVYSMSGGIFFFQALDDNVPTEEAFEFR